MRKLWMAVLGIISASGLALEPAQAAKNITIKGSDTMIVLSQKWAEQYMAKNPGTKIQVTGGGSGIGFAALQNNTTISTGVVDPTTPLPFFD